MAYFGLHGTGLWVEWPRFPCSGSLIVLCSCRAFRHFTLIVPLYTQVYKSGTVEIMLGGNPVMDKHPI